ncbi:Fe-S oxidoreductase, partial [Brachyspira hampsonii 30599]
KYRKKDINNHDISTKVERIKKLVRDEFKDKIDGYFHDVIIHIGDNFEHNRIINKGPDQTRPDQTRPDQTRPDLIFIYVAITYVFIIIQNIKNYNLCCNTILQHRFFIE